MRKNGIAQVGSAPGAAFEDGLDSTVTDRSLDALIREERQAYPTEQARILAVLRKAVFGGALLPGARLRQEDLARRFGTSRVPVREAMRMLEYEGLVESEPHRGFTVAMLDVQEVEEIYELRLLLEMHALKTIVPLITDEDVHELRVLCKGLTESLTPDGSPTLESRARLYQRLYSVSGRPRLVELIMRLRQEHFHDSRVNVGVDDPAYHAQLVEAVIAGDLTLASRLLEGHYRRASGLMRRFMRSAGPRPRS